MSDESQDNIYAEVHQILEDYLHAHRLRVTPERSTIVDTIYAHEGHFTIEMLHGWLMERRFPVSMATLYNNVELLIDAKLLARHYFGPSALYERVHGDEPHYHRVCKRCGMVQDVHFDAITNYITTRHVRGFIVDPSDLYVYGLCSKCKAALRRKQRNSQKKYES